MRFVQSAKFPGLVNGDLVAIDCRWDLLEEFRGLFDDEDSDTWPAGPLPLSGAHLSGQRHQARGVLPQNGFDGLFRHSVFTLSRWGAL